jgi:hypothetical protein
MDVIGTTSTTSSFAMRRVAEESLPMVLGRLERIESLLSRLSDDTFAEPINGTRATPSAASQARDFSMSPGSWSDPTIESVSFRHADSFGTGPPQGDPGLLLRGPTKEFLEASESQAYNDERIREFFHEKHLIVEFLPPGDEHWSILMVKSAAQPDQALAVPVINAGMRRFDVSAFFDLHAHNGVDPIKGRQVLDPAQLAKRQGEWVAIKKGVIDGSV